MIQVLGLHTEKKLCSHPFTQTYVHNNEVSSTFYMVTTFR